MDLIKNTFAGWTKLEKIWAVASIAAILIIGAGMFLFMMPVC